MDFLGTKRADAARRFEPGWAVCALVVATLAIYAPGVSFPFVDFDDPHYVLGNPLVTGGLTWENLRSAFSGGYYGTYHPLTIVSYAAEHAIFGLQPWIYHLDNILIHAATTAVLALFLARATGRPAAGAAVALLFGLHPLHVESVAWVSGRKDVLSTLPAVAGLWAYVEYGRGKSRGAYWLSVLLLALGILAKPMVLTFPLVLLLLDFWPLQRWDWPESWLRPAALRRLADRLAPLVVEKLPHLALSLGFMVVGLAVRWEIVDPLARDAGYGSRLAHGTYSYAFYLTRTLWPAGLAAPYPHADAPPWWLWAASALALGGITWAVVRGARCRPWAVTGWFFYVVTLLPVSGIVVPMPGYQARADRFTYVPLIGIFLLLVWAVDAGLGRLRFARALKPALTAAVAAACALLTAQQLQHWRDSEALYARAIDVTRDNLVALNNYAALRFSRGDLEGAARLYRQALEIRPDYHDALYNLGQVSLAVGRPANAAELFRRAIEAFPQSGLAREGLARAEEALRGGTLESLAARVREDPHDAAALAGLGRMLASAGRPREAEERLREAIAADPGLAAGHRELGLLLAREGRHAEAIPALAQASRLEPGDSAVLVRLGQAFERVGRRDRALAAFRGALELQPGDAEAIEGALRNALDEE